MSINENKVGEEIFNSSFDYWKFLKNKAVAIRQLTHNL